MKMTIRGPRGSRTVRASVDTGATNTVIDRNLAAQLGITATQYQEVVLASGKTESVGVASAELEIQGTRLTVPVYIYDSNLVGMTTLEAAGLRVNPVTRQLEKVPGKLLGIRPRN